MGQTLKCHQRSCVNKPKKKHSKFTDHASDSLLDGSNRVNINLASEEELMTLPGISRAMAHSITVYRRRLGGFRKVEDLSLVTGFGAEKMQQLRPEICVEAVQPSLLRTSLSSCDLLSSTKVNVNTATLQQLLQTRGISEELALAILLYRSQHGAFRQVEDLQNVNGMDSVALTHIKPFITAAMPRPATVYADFKWEGSQRCDEDTRQTMQNTNAGVPPSTPKSTLSMKSLAQPFIGSYAGRNVVRVGNWDLQGLTLEKAENPEIREMICLTLLENGISLLAMQEVLEELTLEKICREMEEPSLLAIKDWPGPRGSWRYIIPESDDETQEVERVAFMWDTSSGLELVSAITLEMELSEKGQRMHCKPLLGHYKVDKLNFKLLNISLKPAGKMGEISCHRAVHLQDLKPYLKEDAQVLVLGNLGTGLEFSSLSLLRDCGFQQCIPVNIHTRETGSTSPQNTETSRTTKKDGISLQDLAFSNTTTTETAVLPSQDINNIKTDNSLLNNIWSNYSAQEMSTGRWGVIQDGLRSLKILDCGSMKGANSQHYPLWVEFYRQ
ncbi:endonuclease/exonuclease/phosphatase family domain-containing protein 1-like isoform X2 [Rhinatrema bivittatum]|uniref:endonuclease/exonuclease/phosphatase family domain-containing protein 1-like isoform X2 n=1 Tax=Rhinatrema bivittatum TaxID=194408 RepID=UPI00112605FE|nr:endonuclease/exonuclease/phosphatase family domain-containing protein 1-like isoform X2 [Rhinatrema bivittatum]